MAADEEKDAVETTEESTEATPKKGPSKLILFGGIGAVCLILGIALAIFVVKPMVVGSPEGEKTDTVEETEHKEESKKKHKGETGEAIVYTISDIVVNPAGTGGSRFLSVSFGFELDDPSLERAMESREPIVRDALITILSSKTVAQLTDPKQKEITRYQIKKRVEQLLKTEALAGVYYTDFVLQ